MVEEKGPKQIMTDDAKEEINAFKQSWTEAILLICHVACSSGKQCDFYEHKFKYFKFVLHITSHFVKKTKSTFLCSKCGKSFSHKKWLESHMAAHFIEKQNYSCNLCDKTFNQT